MVVRHAHGLSAAFSPEWCSYPGPLVVEALEEQSELDRQTLTRRVWTSLPPLLVLPYLCPTHEVEAHGGGDEGGVEYAGEPRAAVSVERLPFVGVGVGVTRLASASFTTVFQPVVRRHP